MSTRSKTDTLIPLTDPEAIIKASNARKRPEKLEAAIRNNALDSLLAPNQSPLHPFNMLNEDP
ncbi:hypothetical protein PGT21_023008 [Puccinia graminis f. sp. tritici]|uniref:Uncharacterized protein n=1 Tax=Puccinia graminis f. sp. tritici TaxID=56615 RepID=A0A5B0NV58_PUCGR|nr:hypothetical protein PGT21_022518 [Puccinia graminis f. sp. tritici]KAA1093055.1 hypothetical protein PGT21_023008 [Puccinia graminis f. sp. tritici]